MFALAALIVLFVAVRRRRKPEGQRAVLQQLPDATAQASIHYINPLYPRAGEAPAEEVVPDGRSADYWETPGAVSAGPTKPAISAKPSPLYADFRLADHAELDYAKGVYAQRGPMLEQLARQRSELQLGPVLGQGTYGEVLRGTLGGEPVAVKRIRRTTLTAGQVSSAVDDLEREAALTASLDHPNVIRVVGICSLGTSEMLLALELCERGSLEDVLMLALDEGRSVQDVGLPWLHEVLEGVASAAEYFGALGCVHRDLAARNVLIDADGRPKVAGAPPPLPSAPTPGAADGTAPPKISALGGRANSAARPSTKV